jgi:hypothetical protein
MAEEKKQEIAMPVLKARVLFSLQLPRLVRNSTDGEGKPGRATMYGKGGRAVRLSVAVRFCRVASFFFKHESNNKYKEDMDKNGLISALSSQLLTIIERDDGNKKKQRMEKEAMLPSV